MPDPKVSIGLAVYNGERYLRQAIESILGQTYTDFELIISDNASTDSTQQICLEYAAEDGRISYHRNATNIGGANNENLTFRKAKAPYFRWAAHDDYVAPQLLERCVAILDTHPDVVLAYPIHGGSRRRRSGDKHQEAQQGHDNTALGSLSRACVQRSSLRDLCTVLCEPMPCAKPDSS